MNFNFNEVTAEIQELTIKLEMLTKSVEQSAALKENLATHLSNLEDNLTVLNNRRHSYCNTLENKPTLNNLLKKQLKNEYQVLGRNTKKVLMPVTLGSKSEEEQEECKKVIGKELEELRDNKEKRMLEGMSLFEIYWPSDRQLKP